MADLVPTRRPSGVVLGLIVGVVAGALGVAVIGFVVNSAATQREAQLASRLDSAADRLSKAEARLQQLSASFAEGESRLRKAEGAVASQRAKEAGLEAERQELTTSPSKYIQTVLVAIADRGIVNAYSRATTATLTNRSRFNLSDLRGVVEYRNADDALIGSAPIEINGALLAGQTATRPVTAGEVSGRSNGQKSRIVVQSAKILQGSE